MASPQPPEQSTDSITISTLSQRAPQTAPARTGAIFGIVGAVLAMVGFFLPWTLQTHLNASPSSPLSYSTASGWDIVINWINGSLTVDPGRTATPVYGFALISAIPLLLAVVVFVVCVISLLRRPGPVLTGLFASAAVLGILSSFVDNPSAYLASAVAAGGAGSVPSSLGTGVAVLYLGYFGIFAGGVIAALSHRPPQSQA